MAIKGIELLPPKIDKDQLIELTKLSVKANTMLVRADSKLKNSLIASGLINFMSLSESVQSTKIEGTQVTFSEIIDARVGSKLSKQKELEKKEVESYQKSLQYTYKKVSEDEFISSRTIKEIQKIIMGSGNVTNSNLGNFREIPNFIGPSKNIKDAIYIPIEAQNINEYMTNLEYYMNQTEHKTFEPARNSLKDNQTVIDIDSDPLIKTAVIHAQFESIHPFLDGNGRTGRILLAIYPIFSEVISENFFFISNELEKERYQYYDLLNKVRGKNPKWYGWIKFFLEASVRFSESLIKVLDELESDINKQMELFNDSPKLGLEFIWLSKNISSNAKDLAKNFNISQTTANKHLKEMLKRGAVVSNGQKRNQIFINYSLLRAVNKIQER